MKGSRIANETLARVKEVQAVQTLFGTEELEEGKRNGRDAELIAARNVHIMYRYHYWLTIENLNWPKTLALLSEQFYLSEVTINKIITENTTLRRQIINENPSLKDLEKKYLSF